LKSSFRITHGSGPWLQLFAGNVAGSSEYVAGHGPQAGAKPLIFALLKRELGELDRGSR
jgi:hypothetical protein